MNSDDHSSISDVEWLSVETPQKKPRILVIFGIVVGVFFALLTIVLFVSVVVRRVQSFGEDVEVASLRSRSQLQKEAVTAFHDYDASQGAFPGIAEELVEERSSIDQLLQDLRACANADDNEKFRDLVDFDRMLKRIELTGAMAGYSVFEKRYLKGELKDMTNLSEHWKEMVVVSASTPPGDRTTRILYVLTRSSEYDEYLQFRFLIGQDGSQWKLYDWERLDLGLWESFENSLYLKYNGRPVIDGLNRWGELMLEADELTAEFEHDAAAEKLRLGEAQVVPREVEARCLLLTAYRWQHVNKPEEAERCLLNVKKPKEAPGVYESLMHCYRWKDLDKAIHYAELSEQEMGPTPSLLQIKAGLYSRNGEQEKASSEWNKLLKMEPEDLYALRELLLALPSEKKSEFSENLQRIADQHSTIATLASSMSWQDVDALKFLVGYVNQHYKDSPLTHYVSGLLYEYEGNYQQATEEFRRAMDTEEEEESQTLYSHAYLDTMITLGRGVEAFRHLPDRKSAYESITYDYYEEESSLSVEERRQISEIYCREFPDSLAGYDNLASIALEQGALEEAENIVRQALSVRPELTDPNSEDQNSAHVSSMESTLASALYQLGRIEEAFEVGREKNGQFFLLSQLASQRQDWAQLEKLIHLYRAEKRGPEFYGVEANLYVSQEQWGKALDSLKRGERLAEDIQKLSFQKRISEMHVANDTWIDYYRSSADRDEAYTSLSEVFISNDQWQQLQRLAELHAGSIKQRIPLRKPLADAAWELSDYGEFIRHATALLESEDDDAIPSYLKSDYQDRLLIALIKSDRWQEAEQLALRRQVEEENSKSTVILETVKGNFREAERLATKEQEENEYSSDFYSHDLVSNAFLGDHFDRFREDHPVVLPYNVKKVTGILRAKEPWQLDADLISSILDNENATSRNIVHVSSERENVSDVCFVRIGNACIWIATGTGKFLQELDVSKASHPLLVESNKNKQWLAAGVFGMTDLGRKPAEIVARKLLGNLRKESEILLTSDANYWGELEAYSAGDELLDYWVSHGSVPLALGQGLSLYPWQRRKDTTCDREFELSLRKAAKTPASQNGSQLTLVTYLIPELKAGAMRMRVESVSRNYGGLQFVGTLTEPASAISGFSKGLNFKLNADRVSGWQIGDKPIVFREDCHL